MEQFRPSPKYMSVLLFIRSVAFNQLDSLLFLLNFFAQKKYKKVRTLFSDRLQKKCNKGGLSEMILRRTTKTSNTISVVCIAAFTISVFSTAYFIQFLYNSLILSIDKRLLYFQMASILSFISVIIFKDLPMSIKPHKRYLILSIFPICFCVAEFFYGFEFAFDPMNYFYSLEKTWYNPLNFDAVRNIQKKLHCCDFQASIIDSVNECHHGFSPPCLRVFFKKNSTSVVICGFILITEGIAHLAIIYLCIEMINLTKSGFNSPPTLIKNVETPLSKFKFEI